MALDTNSTSLAPVSKQIRFNYYAEVENILKTNGTTEETRLALLMLPSRMRFYIQKRFGLDGNKPMTYRQIGELDYITAGRVRQIVDHGLWRLLHGNRYKVLIGEYLPAGNEIIPETYIPDPQGRANIIVARLTRKKAIFSLFKKGLKNSAIAKKLKLKNNAVSYTLSVLKRENKHLWLKIRRTNQRKYTAKNNVLLLKERPGVRILALNAHDSFCKNWSLTNCPKLGVHIRKAKKTWQLIVAVEKMS